jgi:hypothetical protein
MASKDTALLVYDLMRARGAQSKSEAQATVTLPDITNFKKVEPTLAAGSTGWTCNMSEVGGTAQGFVLITPRPVSVKLNGDAAGKPCGSVWFLFDTTIISVVIDNNIQSPAADVKPEIWLIAR